MGGVHVGRAYGKGLMGGARGKSLRGGAHVGLGRAYGEGLWEGLTWKELMGRGSWEGLMWEEELMGRGSREGSYSVVPNVRWVESGHKTRAHIEACGRGQDHEPRYTRFVSD